jgi:CheY-like chemotaxis protein
MKKKIFDEFMQIDDSHYKRGIGLGLAIVKKLTGKIGAYINLKSHIGLGSIFTLYLPKASSNKNEKIQILENEVQYDVLPQITTTDANETFVLVVDQDDDARNAFEILSTSFGVNFITGDTSKNIISKITNLQSIPKIIIVDGGSAIEEPLVTINNIQEEFNKEIPVILITDDLESESLVMKTDQEIVPLQKPFSTSKLQQLIQSILNRPL